MFDCISPLEIISLETMALVTFLNLNITYNGFLISKMRGSHKQYRRLKDDQDMLQ